MKSGDRGTNRGWRERMSACAFSCVQGSVSIPRRFLRILRRRDFWHKNLSALLLLAILTGEIVGISALFVPAEVEAAQVTIDNAVSTTQTEHIIAGSQTVFISDQVGYKFYVDSTGSCVYSKTTNGGSVWGTAVQIDSQTDCMNIAVWYDRWTPNDFGDTIHVVTIDSSSNEDNIFYNALDTTTDTRLTGAAAINTDPGNVQTYVFAAGANMPSITKATNGRIYVAVDDASDSVVLSCSTTCGTGTNWAEVGTRPQDLANDYSILMPLTNGDIMLINRDISLEDIRSKIWNGTAWSASWTFIDTNATDNATYDVGLAATLASSTVAATTTLFLAYTADNATPGTDDDIRTGRYQGGLWATSTSASISANVTTNDTKGITNISIGRDENTGNIYVAYNAQTTANTASTGNVYWRMSTTSMASWSAEVGSVSTSSDDFYGIDLPLRSSHRMFVSWYGITSDDIFGDTIADLVPGAEASTTNAQVAEVLASTTNFYIGGTFSIRENIDMRDVTDITIEENGTADGENVLKNIKLFYENDTTFPYNCASESYAGTESRFGATSTNFSSADGTADFSGSASISTTSTLCVYTVLDVLDTAVNDSTINVFISNASTSIAVSGGDAIEVRPQTAIDMTGSTVIKNDVVTQTHFHWRYDDGVETAATSRTGGVEDTGVQAFQTGFTRRLRLGLSNEGGTSSPSMAYRLEYSVSTSTCAEAYLWTDVGAADDEWNMSDSIHVTDGNDTTNIAEAIGGVSDENSSFKTPNGGLRDTSSQTGSFILTETEYTDLEYAVIASSTAVEGNTYCFRVTDKGDPLPAYTNYARATIAANVAVTATSSQVATGDVPTQNFYVGGAYVITENVDARNITSITIGETGTIDASQDVSNIKLRYDLDTTAPYDCSSESYSGAESQFGSTDTDGFSSDNGTSTFTGSVAISTTSTMCLYTVLDITEFPENGETIDIVIPSPATDIVVTGGGSVAPTITRDITGSTTLRAAALTQSRYHWRNDGGAEASSLSRTNGAEGIALASLYEGTPVRLRVAVSNEGATTTPSTRFRIEYGQKITSCDAVASWIDIGDVGGAWDMYDSPNVTDGANTTDIAVNFGGVTNDNTTFKTPNGGVKDTSSLTASTTVLETEFIELEYSIKQTTDAGFSTPYCFRVTKNGTAFPAYTLYPELTTSPERDFKIQHGTSTVTGNGITLVAGVDYVAPSASTSAFMRIINSSYTGAGQNAGGGTQNASNVTAALLNPWNIMTSVTIARPAGATSNTRVSWEIVEFVGKPGSDNEMIVRQQRSVPYTATGLFATGTALADADIADDRDIVVFITGQLNPNAGTAEYNNGLSTSSWASTTNQAVFQRGEANSIIATTSYAVVEFKGPNWKIQRAQHTYTTSGGAPETEDITAVNSTTRTFLHTQKRVGNLAGTDEYGHEVWLTSVGQLSLRLEAGATSPSLQTAVVWVIENTQTSTGAMTVTRSAYSSTGGTEPLTTHFNIGTTLSDVENTSLAVTNSASSTTSLFPRPILGAMITSSTTQYQIWRSDTGAAVKFHAEVVEWPVAGTVLRQNKYRFFVDNNALIPTDPWPLGASDLGESTVLTDVNEPLGGGERLRIRMTIAVINSSLPEESQDFRLQYAERVTSCSAVDSVDWFTVGDAASTTSLWRGYAATGTTDGTPLSGDPPTGGDLKILSVDGIAGTFEEENDSPVNPYRVEENQDLEYDWLVQQNNALADTMYCFRMVKADGSTLDGYLDYPQARTASFSPVSQKWRWYDDEGSVTPSSPLEDEGVAPIDVAEGNSIKLRITVRDIENVVQPDARFRLQFSEYSDFSTSTEMVSTTTCTGNSLWCYVDAAGTDNATIQSAVLSDADSCVAGVGRGCGTHNESSLALTGYTHAASSSSEYEFAIKSDGPRINRAYYFRMYDVINDIPVPLGDSESYPSLMTEGASLVFSAGGLATSTATEGVTTDVATTPEGIAYGTLTPDVPLEAAQRFTVTTNATQGYSILMYSDSPFVSSHGESIRGVNASNTAPLAWSTACAAEAYGCYGYHVGDDALEGGSTRFAPVDTYAAFETTPREVAYSSIPVTNDTVDIVFRVLGRELQQAGQYETSITFVTVPAF